VAESLLARPDVQRLIPRGIELRWGTEVLSRAAGATGRLRRGGSAIITGEYLQDAKATRDPLTNQSVVNFVLSRRGGRIFERETGRHVNDYMAIILDGRVQGQPPVIKSPDRAARTDRAGRQAAAGRPGSGAGAQGGALPAPSDHRGGHHRAVAGQDSIRDGIPCRGRGVASSCWAQRRPDGALLDDREGSGQRPRLEHQRQILASCSGLAPSSICPRCRSGS